MKSISLLSAADQVAEHLRQALTRGELSGAIPGVRPLAAELGVNHKTVKAALKQLEDEGLLVSQGVGLRRKIVLPSDHAPPGLRIAVMDSHSKGADYVVDLRHRLEAAGHVSFFADKNLLEFGWDKARVARHVRGVKADAWIVCSGSRDILEWFAQQEKPAFALFGVRDGVPIASAGPDKRPTLTEATRRLIELGHRRMSFIVRREHRLPTPSPPLLAFLDELEAADIETGTFNLPDWEETQQGFERLLDSLLAGPTPPTALILTEAFEFHAAYHYLSQRGLRTPQDVSLICTDD
ncbi:MAG: GntR family transcriptional regulator, partial [Haloferula sp.]